MIIYTIGIKKQSQMLLKKNMWLKNVKKINQQLKSHMIHSGTNKAKDSLGEI